MAGQRDRRLPHGRDQLHKQQTDFPDAPISNPDSIWQNDAKYYACGPRLHEYLQRIGQVLKEYDAFSVGEMPEVNDCDEILKAVGFDRGELSMIFHFELYVLLALHSKADIYS